MASLSDAMQTLVGEIRRAGDERRSEIHNIDVGTQELLDHYGAERQQMAQALKEELASQMRALMDACHQSTEERKVAVSEGRSETHNLLERFRLEHQEMAQALKEELASQMRALLDACHQSTEERKVAVSEGRSETHNLLERFRLEHQEMAQALAKKLEREDKEMREATKARMEEIREALGDLRDALRMRLEAIASDVSEAGRIWRGAPKKEAPPAKKVTVKVEQEVQEEPAVAERESFEEKVAAQAEQVLQVVKGHPDGVRLVDIGNELGVDWRTLIAAAKSLTDQGKAEKIDYLYYPPVGSKSVKGKKTKKR